MRQVLTNSEVCLYCSSVLPVRIPPRAVGTERAVHAAGLLDGFMNRFDGEVLAFWYVCVQGREGKGAACPSG